MNIARVLGVRHKIFYGWWVVLAALGISTFGSGVWFYGSPVFFSALLAEFGWSRAVASGAISLSRLEGGFEAPLMGYLADRFGPRKLAIFGAAIAGIGFLLFSQLSSFSLGSLQVSALVAFYLLYVGVLSIGYNTGFTQATMVAVNSWFRRKRSRAFAVWSMGGGLSGPVVLLLGWFVATFGWRAAAIAVAFGVWGIVLPLALLLRHKPEQYGYLPDGEDIGRGITSAEDEHSEYDFSVKEAMLSLSFWLLIGFSAARSLAMTSVLLHQVVYLVDKGISLPQASAALGALVAFSLVGRLSMGIAGDFIDKRYLLALACILQAAGILALDRVTTITDVWLYVAVYSVGYGGAIPLYTAVIGDYFGRKRFATIRGFMQLFVVPATVAGPVFAGWVYDVTRSYHTAFIIFIGALLLGALLVLFARRPKPRAPLAQKA